MTEKKEYRNLLALWFGAYLTFKRKRSSVTYDDLGEALNLSAQYIRMAENGLTSISPGRIYDLILGMYKAFTLDIKYSPLSAFLVAVQVIPTQGTLANIQDAIDKLLTSDNKALLRLLRNLEPKHLNLLERENYQELKDIFSGNELVEEMEAFLTKPSYGSAQPIKIEQEWSEIYNHAPSFWNNYISDELKRLEKHLSEIGNNLPYHNIVMWEKKNLGQVMKFLGVVSNIDVLMEYIGGYDWGEYFNKNIPFTIYLPEKSMNSDIPKLLAKMEDIYKKDRAALNSVMKIHGLSPEQIKALRKTLALKENASRVKDESIRKNYFDCWIYELNNDSNIGFVFDSNDRQNYDQKGASDLTALDMENQVNRYRNLTNLQIKEVCDIVNFHKAD